MTYKRFTSFMEDDGYWIRDESDFKIIATGLKFGVAENLIAMLNGLTAKNKVLYKEIERLKTQNKDLLYTNANNMELLEKENEQLKQSVNNLKDTIIKITIAYQRKYDRNIVKLVHEVHDEDITDLIKELQE